MDAATQVLMDRLRQVPPDARKLFCVIVQQAYHGPIHPKLPGVATPAEILEACGLDVGDFYSLLAVLAKMQLILVSGDYPFEEIRLTAAASAAELLAERCLKSGMPLQEILVNLQTGSLPK